MHFFKRFSSKTASLHSDLQIKLPFPTLSSQRFASYLRKETIDSANPSPCVQFSNVPMPQATLPMFNHPMPLKMHSFP